MESSQAKSARTKRKQLLESYYKNPNKCLYCDNIIEVYGGNVADAKKKKFCNRTHSAVYNNKKRTKPAESKNKKPRFLLENLTKSELKDRYTSILDIHSTIRQHSRKIYEKSNKPKICFVCGYDLHVDICHINDVQSFQDNITMKEINDITNLIALCKNHHWEFDNGYLKIVGMAE